MVIPHLRVNYLTRNKWLGNNLEDREYTQRGQHAGCWMFVCFVISDHNTALLVSCPGEDLCRCESILKKGFIWYDLLEPYDSSEWEIYVRFDEKIDAISSLSSCNDGTVFYFLSRNNLHYIKALSDQKPPLDVVLLICTSKTNTFSFVIQPHLLIERYGKTTRDITAYVPFLCLGDPYNCKHMKGFIGKQIVFVLLHHICFISTSQHMYVTSPLTVPGNNWVL